MTCARENPDLAAYLIPMKEAPRASPALLSLPVPILNLSAQDINRFYDSGVLRSKQTLMNSIGFICEQRLQNQDSTGEASRLRYLAIPVRSSFGRG